MAVLLVTHAPDGAVAVFADKKSFVSADGDSDGATPDFAVWCDKAGDKIFAITPRLSGRMIKRYAHDLVAGAFPAIPGTVERGEDVAFVFGRKLVAIVKAQVVAGRVRLHKYIGNDNLAGEIKVFSRNSRDKNHEQNNMLRLALSHFSGIVPVPNIARISNGLLDRDYSLVFSTEQGD